MNTIAATTRRVPRAALVGVVVLVAAFALLMIVRAGLLDGSTSNSTSAATPATVTRSTPARAAAAPAKPRVVLLPNLPAQIAHSLRYSRVVVVSLYATPADRAAIAHIRVGARRTGAGFTALSLTNEKNARSLSSFVGSVASPAVLVVRRPGKIVNRLSGSVDSAVVAQAAHNAGARR